MTENMIEKTSSLKTDNPDLNIQSCTLWQSGGRTKRKEMKVPPNLPEGTLRAVSPQVNLG